jgi:predicted RNase H-like nuclease (RuvC/YqgF family)
MAMPTLVVPASHTGQKRKYGSIIAKKDELINEQSEKIKQLEDECKQLREELEKSHNEGGNKNSKKKQFRKSRGIAAI